MRNPLQFILNFSSSSREIVRELGEMLEKPEGVDWDEVKELVGDLENNTERVLHHSGRANGIVSAMLTLDRGVGGAFRPVDPERVAGGADASSAPGPRKSYEAGFEAEITTELEEGLEEVVAVPEDIARVIRQLGDKWRASRWRRKHDWRKRATGRRWW